jgi:hypothetical protein
MAAQFGEAVLDSAERDPFTGLVGPLEDVDCDPFGVLLTHGAIVSEGADYL